MSVVWRGYDEVLGRAVAIKVLAGRYAADPAFRARMRDEAQVVARLSHPHVTAVYDFGESVNDQGQSVPYVVMELLPGISLAQRLTRGPIPTSAALRMCAEIASALAAAHARGLVHRDVKPGNVMLTPGGAKVVDFGIAALVGEEIEPEPDGMMLGTPAYLAPERLEEDRVLPATDVYALGVLLFRVLTGTMPWTVENTAQILTAHTHGTPAALPPLLGVPAAVGELYRRCLAKDPARRPASHEVAKQLAAAAGISVPLGGVDLDSEPGLSADELATTMLPRLGARAAAEPRADARGWVKGAAVAAVGIVALGTGALVLLAGSPRRSDGAAPAKDKQSVHAVAQGAPCQVLYHVTGDVAGVFATELTVRNNDSVASEHWRLAFAFPGGQSLTEGRGADWAADGSSVTATGRGSTTTLGPGVAIGLAFTGTYRDTNPMPIAFTVNGRSCAYTLIGPNGVTRTGGPPVGTGRAARLPNLAPGTVVTIAPSAANPVTAAQATPTPTPQTDGGFGILSSPSPTPADTETSTPAVPPDDPASSAPSASGPAEPAPVN
jgi:serine/threonine-protein kinase